VTLRLGEIVIDCADHEVVVPFWLEAMGDYTRVDVNAQYVGITAAERAVGRPAILFQKVPEPKAGKNRVHLDLRGETMAGEVERLKSLGATFIAERTLGESTRWTVMADPEGNEFCVSGER
jgi:predicted enzyme related to lactoylglutathione lyase